MMGIQLTFNSCSLNNSYVLRKTKLCGIVVLFTWKEYRFLCVTFMKNLYLTYDRADKDSS